MHVVHAIFIYKHFTFKFMALHKPLSALDNENFELYNVVYTGSNNEDLYEFFQNRNSLKWTPYRKSVDENGEISFVVSPKISENDYEKWLNNWNEDSYTDKNVYSVVRDKEFTIIIYNSTDCDSVLTKDIVLKQYEKVYNRNTADWKIDGVITYNIITNTPEQVTFEGKNIFDLNCIKDIKIKEVFLCGYDISDSLFRQMTQLSERVFVFENNVFKINAIRSVLKTNNTKLCTSKTSTKAYQAYMLLRDPIGNIKRTDNKGVEILKDYSDAVMNAFIDYSDWEHCEKVKYAFENKITDDDWRGKLVEVLFGSEKSIDISLDLESAATVLETESEFAKLLDDKKYLLWAGDVIAVNTKYTPTFADVNKLIHDDRKYSKIVTFYKDNEDFWTVNIYKADRDLCNEKRCGEALSQNHLGVQNVWYTETGIPVVKVENIRNNDIIGVKWYNVSGKRPVQVNHYVPNFNGGQYVFDKYYKDYFTFTKKSDGEIIYDGIADENQKDKSPLVLNGKLQTYSLSGESTNITFKHVYPDLSDINFNKISLIDLLRHKYYCSGNKYVVSCSLTDKQMYDCLKTKSIMG